MAIENDPDARIHMVSRGEMLHPGSCMVCGSGDPERTYLTLGVFFDYEGSMYICHLCGVQIGETLGLFTPEEVKIMTEAVANLQARLDSAEEELNHARPIMVGIRGLLNDPVFSASLGGTARTEDDEGNESGDPAVSDEFLNGVPGIGASGESTPKESTPVAVAPGISFS